MLCVWTFGVFYSRGRSGSCRLAGLIIASCAAMNAQCRPNGWNMIDNMETQQDVERLLREARGRLQSFEDGVDRHRLLKRIKLSSPAHPVLLLRALFLLIVFVLVIGVAATLAIPFMNADLGRQLARYDSVVQAAGIPGIPVLLLGMAACIFFAWVMATGAALALGRDAQMLPWEQKKHQQLVNEVTRLTTQKAVMERMKNTPAGARPRIDTPVPVSLRGRPGLGTPAGGSVLGGGRPSPPPLSKPNPGQFGDSGSGSAGNPFGRAPGSEVPAASRETSGGGLFGRPPSSAPMAEKADGASYSRPGGTTPFVTPAPALRGNEGQGTLGGASAAGGGGILARARSGHVKTTPMGAAGRLARAEAGNNAESAGSTEGVNIFGTPPAGGRVASPAGNQETGNPFHQSGTSASLQSDVPDIVESASPYSSRPGTGGMDENALVQGGQGNSNIPTWGPIDEPWLEQAVTNAETFTQSLPEQVRMVFSEESFVPFGIVISRATPAVAVRAMVGFIEFLSSIPTVPRARIELSGNSSLDRSFHRNVEAALEPFYSGAFQVELEPGRVEIVFTQPDPVWQEYPLLPIE